MFGGSSLGRLVVFARSKSLYEDHVIHGVTLFYIACLTVFEKYKFTYTLSLLWNKALMNGFGKFL